MNEFNFDYDQQNIIDEDHCQQFLHFLYLNDLFKLMHLQNFVEESNVYKYCYYSLPYKY